jgi:hypothetical protein
MPTPSESNRSENAQKVRRWYDTDPVLLEVLNFMELAPKSAEAYAQKLISGVEKATSKEALNNMLLLADTGKHPKNRWYDAYPVLSKAIELLKMMPHDAQRVAAMQFIESTRSDQATYTILKETFAVADMDLTFLDEDYDDETLYMPFDAAKELSQATPDATDFLVKRRTQGGTLDILANQESSSKQE